MTEHTTEDARTLTDDELATLTAEELYTLSYRSRIMAEEKDKDATPFQKWVEEQPELADGKLTRVDLTKTPEGATWLPATLALQIEAMTDAELGELRAYVNARLAVLIVRAEAGVPRELNPIMDMIDQEERDAPTVEAMQENAGHASVATTALYLGEDPPGG